jgi:serine/threonine protein phosphatase PrpC
MSEDRQQSIDSAYIVPAMDGPDLETVAVGGGVATLYSAVSPAKPGENEDTAGVFPYGPDAAVLAVADGAGGMPGGRRASRLAIGTLAESLRDAHSTGLMLRTAVLNAMEAANLAILQHSRGSATTLTAVSVEGREARSFHVGDSAAFITGQRTAVKLQTVAHSPVGFAVASGFLSELEGIHHAERNVVSNFLGTPEMIIEVGAPIRLAKYDSVLLASDGLTDNLHVGEILDRMRRGDQDDCTRRLVELAARRMREPGNAQPSKPDDLTLILFRKR